jgi:hypothetical protein
MDKAVFLAALAIVFLTFGYLRRRLQPEQLAFFTATSAMTAVIPLVTDHVHPYWGLNRYLLIAPIIYLCAGQLVRKHTAVYVLWLLACVALYWHVELCSFVTQGYPIACPCLGRFEFALPFKS